MKYIFLFFMLFIAFTATAQNRSPYTQIDVVFDKTFTNIDSGMVRLTPGIQFSLDADTISFIIEVSDWQHNDTNFVTFDRIFAQVGMSKLSPGGFADTTFADSNFTTNLTQVVAKGVTERNVGWGTPISLTSAERGGKGLLYVRQYPILTSTAFKLQKYRIRVYSIKKWK